MQLEIKQLKDQIEKLESQVSANIVTVLPNMKNWKEAATNTA
jgi:hypothetical protein